MALSLVLVRQEHGCTAGGFAIVTKKDIIREVYETLDLTQEQARQTVQLVLDVIVDGIVKKGRVELRNFGVFEVRRRKPRRARNPSTGLPVEIKAKYVVTFQPGKVLEDEVRKNGDKIPNVKETPSINPLDPTVSDEEEDAIAIPMDGRVGSDTLNGHVPTSGKKKLPNKPR